MPAPPPPGATPPAVQVVDLVKRFPRASASAVASVTFAVERGEIFGLLGPNGAGKSTTIGILTTRARPTSGSAHVAGVDVVANPVGARRHLAVVPQRNNLDRSLSVRQNLLFHAAYHGVPARERAARAEELLAQFGLDARADDKVDFFSGGQMQRAMIARALMHAPEVLFLDEPATGLDPAARLFVWERIRELREQGVTILLTTHDMDEAAALCDRVGIMDHGRILALDTPGALTRMLPGRSALEVGIAIGGADDAALLEMLASLDGVERAEATHASPDQRRIHLYLTGDAPATVALVAKAVAGAHCTLTDIRIASASLEDVFIALTGRTLR